MLFTQKRKGETCGGGFAVKDILMKEIERIGMEEARLDEIKIMRMISGLAWRAMEDGW